MTGLRGLTKEMSLTRSDFLRDIPAALRGWTWSVHEDADAVIVTAQGPDAASVSITQRDLPPRTLGQFSIPRSDVVIDLGTLTGDAANAFIDQFNRTFQRGGG